MKKSILRQQAEEKLGKQKSAAAPKTEADTMHLLHELQVHQIELEMQNEELVQARAESEAAYRQYTDLYDFAPMGYFTMMRDGTISKVNLAGANLLGWQPVDLLNRRLGLLASDESRSVFNAFFDVLLVGEGKKTCELVFEKKEDEPLWARLEATCFEGGEECPVAMLDITERKRAEELIRQYASELELRVQERTAELIYANHAKDEFLAAMSHELRTPLNGILGYSEILLEGLHGSINQKQSQALEIIYSSGQHLLGLINDILDVSKIESGLFELHLENVSVDSICQSSLVFIKQLALKKSIAVEYAPSPSSPTIFADPIRLKQILVNLLNNAVKFTPENGNVKLDAREDTQAGQIQFFITDSGIGITPEDQKKLFKPFVQLDSSLSRQYEGTGLGLSLVKQFVEMHGGSVGVESEAGKGSCFHFTIPTRSANTQGGENELPSRIKQNETETGQRETSARILLVEDNAVNMMVTSDYLSAMGYQVIKARDGLEAIEQACEQSPDLILMDIQMPGINGLEVIKRLRTMPEFVSVPIIALTALAMPGDLERCLEAGATEYLTKPFGLEKLKAMMANLL